MYRDRIHVLVGVPSQELWQAEFGMSLGFLLSWSVSNRLFSGSKKERVDVINYKGSILPQLREKIVEYALSINATHLLFVDSDQTFPKDVLRKLLGHELPVVAANIPTKTTPAAPTARRQAETPGGSLIHSHDKEGLEEVWRIGTGLMLIDMEIFKVLEPPYFSMYWDSQVEAYRGEDWVFCEKIQEAGFPIFADHTVSKQIGHLGVRKFTHDDIPPAEETLRVLQEQESKEKAA